MEEKSIEEKKRMLIEELDISSTIKNKLKYHEIHFIDQILEQTEREILKMRNFGPKSFMEVICALKKLDIDWPNSPTYGRIKNPKQFRTLICARCGKAFTVSLNIHHKLYCSSDCMKNKKRHAGPDVQLRIRITNIYSELSYIIKLIESMQKKEKQS